jgi:hypothetical protein
MCFWAECHGIKLCHCADYYMYAMCRYDVCYYCKCRGAIFSLFFPFSLSTENAAMLKNFFRCQIYELTKKARAFVPCGQYYKTFYGRKL